MRRDFEALEKRRMAAVRLFPTDLNNSEIGRRLKICESDGQPLASAISGRR